MSIFVRFNIFKLNYKSMINYEVKKEQQDYVSPACRSFQIKMKTALLAVSYPYETQEGNSTDGFTRANDVDW